MAETKYGKYIIEYDSKRWPTERRPVMCRLEDSVIKGSNFYLIHWVMPGVEATVGDFKYAGHPPHIHKDTELLFHIGTNPDDPMDLGGEVEMYLGPELERHVFNRTCCVFIPPNFIHSPWRPLKTTRPWIFMEINQGSRHTEKFYPQLLPEEARNKINWDMWKDEGIE
ncbi:MAG: hypothetical protein JXA46_10160 [Dehalococcoidales bacterium]|nr:hypothetical protein [Dehalococcoidales bacterium]